MNSYLKPQNRLRAFAMLLAAGLAVSALPMTALAQQYIPPDVGLPGRREGGGTRGDCAAVGKSLTALMPDNNFGYTTEGYPTFYWYVPQIGAEAAEFVLLDENNNEIYITSFQIADSPGLISLSLPSTAGFPPLEPGKNYHWYFSLVCDFADRSGDIFTDGWVQRIEIEPGSALDNRLNTEPVSEHPIIFAEASIWFNALDLLAQAMQNDPVDPSVEEKWSNLLGSVGLNDVVEEPFVLHVQEESEESSPDDTDSLETDTVGADL